MQSLLTLGGVGAVALPDGRVLICGGSYTELASGGRVIMFFFYFRDQFRVFLGSKQQKVTNVFFLFQHAGRNSTSCWYWIHGTTTIKPLEFYSKLPFEWLGPFTPQLMKLIKFESPDAIANPMGTNVISGFFFQF